MIKDIIKWLGLIICLVLAYLMVDMTFTHLYEINELNTADFSIWHSENYNSTTCYFYKTSNKSSEACANIIKELRDDEKKGSD